MTDADERLAQLLADRASEGLSDEAQAELAALAGPAERDDGTWEQAAAALERALFPGDEALPAALAASLEAQGRQLVAAGQGSPRSIDLGQAPAGRSAAWSGRPAVVPVQRSATLLWWAVAASVLAVFGWLPSQRDETGDTVPIVQSLLSRADTLRLDWASTAADPASAGASGDVLWNAALQQGLMRFSGLARNDPTVEQYQLWIFDAERDDRYPVDGGVFDVVGDEVIVPITARLDVGRPVLFAVTVERPGGVVVSARERIVMAAAVQG